MAGKELPSGPTSVTVRRNIAHFRQDLGMTYAELSRELGRRGHGIPPLGLRRIEAGERRVDVDDLAAVALALNVNLRALLLPREMGSTVLCGVTGYGEDHLNSEMVWQWERGIRSLTHPFDAEWAGPAFAARVRPREVLSAEERYARRERWVRSQLLQWEEQVALWRQEDDAPGDPFRSHYYSAEIEQLQELDPCDDGAWALFENDPAPPAGDRRG